MVLLTGDLGVIHKTNMHTMLSNNIKNAFTICLIANILPIF